MTDSPSDELRDRWVKPLYMNFFEQSSDAAIRELWPEMTAQRAQELLSYLNWRPRIVGAFLVALREMHELTHLVGRLFLRSDVCDAGVGYCLALARLNTPASRQYLFRYLDYYLTQNDLWFDQGSAMGAVAFLDGINATNELTRFTGLWDSFTKNKPNWDLSRACAFFAGQMVRVNALVERAGR